MKNTKEEILKEARRIFNPYGVELNFDEKDWEVFLNRINLLFSQAIDKAYKHGYNKGWMAGNKNGWKRGIKITKPKS